jgi:hypothetical protein
MEPNNEYPAHPHTVTEFFWPTKQSNDVEQGQVVQI